MPQSPRSHDDRDRLGFDETRDYLGAAVAALLPSSVVTRGVSVSVETDRAVYAPGDPVSLRVEIRNRLPVPIAVSTPSRRLWGWEVDGALEATEEPRRDPGGSGVLTFRARERKTHEWTWDGRVTRQEGRRNRSTPLSRGDHEIRAFVATERERPESRTTIRVE
ncbi:hypothetical protein Hbl1158_13825 [Halobaculum sp. CBA1158]|uniref:hypothetical protein n=1 Tax=Halobaculum sp. CBA1158 TaxID=2904243 RepID=UPI001F1C1815|nr:hypothetical protein [Halobaculum sp. CBA1158]UIO99587.1 hypothetical protein Hbl1158_13825 [Halobaculum sp. CBA1158]